MRKGHQNNLTALVFNDEQTFPTPTTRDHRGAYTEKALTRKDGKSRATDQLPNAVLNGQGCDNFKGYHLNPDWVEWLMGWPIGWSHTEGVDSWEILSWESEHDIPRITKENVNRKNRLIALGNGQVPACVELAWRLLSLDE
jgi:hypothetical protein